MAGIIQRPPCPRCGTRTMLARVTPGKPGIYIRTFDCPACGHVHQVVIAASDLMRAGEADGWLRGQLQAPT
jgi:hypothetical protein